MLCRLVLFVSLSGAGLSGSGLCAQQVPDAVAASLQRAGDARADYERVYAQANAAEQVSLAFVLRHMPEHDFGKVSADMLLENVRLAHAARNSVPWGAELSDELFHNYVVPYAQANETRESWRASMVEQFLPLVSECKTAGEAALVLNKQIFKLVNVHYSTKRRRADQSPSESIAQGKASCTGLSILLADACRACCVPARMISVKWPHKAGNHTWVEVFDGTSWRFVGADEPDPKGFDRAWFVGDAEKCHDADRAHRIWAVSFADTGERIASGWGAKMWGVDVTARYAADTGGGDRASDGASAQDRADDGLRGQIDRYFAADENTKATFSFDRNLDQELKTAAGDARLRKLVWQSLQAHDATLLQADHDALLVRAGDKQSAFTIKEVGEKPEGGWPLVIAMHGGGATKKSVNDSQWRHMQIYYKDHPEVGGYLYCALRAPTDEWNGFYTDYFYPLLEKLIRQFVVCSEVNPDRVIAIGYSHGGYGAFAVGPKLPHRFAAVHASASAPTDGQSVPDGLHSLRFSFMVGGKDTVYGRRKRCEAFEAQLQALQKSFPGLYATKFTLVEGNGHGGLPDRDLLQELIPHQRTALPERLYWRLTDATVKHHYWLRVAAPKPGVEISAQKQSSSSVLLSSPVPIELWLDARLVDMSAPLVVTPAILLAEGISNAVKAGKFQPAPALRTLCATMQERGDPNLAASWILVIE